MVYGRKKERNMKLKIDVWTDFVCQFCYIGKRELENAIEVAGMKDMVDINYHAYQLTPDAPKEAGNTFYEMAATKLGMDEARMKQMAEATQSRGAALGLEYNFDNLQDQNTLVAHRVSKYAEEVGKDKEYQERLFKAHFTENRFFGDGKLLVELGQEIGLDGEKIKTIVEDDQAYLDDVKQDIALARQIGVQGVPFYVFNEQYAISGAQPGETFVELLEKLKKELNLKAPLQVFGSDDAACGPDGCEI